MKKSTSKSQAIFAISIDFITCLLYIAHGKYLINGSLFIITFPDPIFKIANAEQVFLLPEPNTLLSYVQSLFFPIDFFYSYYISKGYTYSVS